MCTTAGNAAPLLDGQTLAYIKKRFSCPGAYPGSPWVPRAGADL
jgi:hypothetical protein